HRFGRGKHGALAEGVCVEHGVAAADEDDGAWKLALRDRFVHQLADAAKRRRLSRGLCAIESGCEKREDDERKARGHGDSIYTGLANISRAFTFPGGQEHASSHSPS